MSFLFFSPAFGAAFRPFLFLLPLLAGFLLDLLLGDPRGFPHPVVWMGRAIAGLEPWLRKKFSHTPRGERAAGRVLAFVLPAGTLGLSLAALWAVSLAGPLWALTLESVWCWQALALRDLREESLAVGKALVTEGLEAARRAVGRIVGRETACLDEAGVLRAAVETVAENLSDGVIAPLFYMTLGGAPLALCYKAVNTMDSMVGYKNEHYLNFGRAAARLDDAANFLPSRLAALLLVTAAFGERFDGRGAFHIWRRDRFCHASPNSAQTESACAGALGLRLGGDAIYFGQLVHKHTLGDNTRPICRADISRACRLLYGASFLGMALALAARYGIFVLLTWAGF